MLKSGTVTIYRPRRSKPRVYTAADVGRIACYAIADGADPKEVSQALKKCAPCQCEDDETTLLALAAALGLAGLLVGAFLPILSTVTASALVRGLVRLGVGKKLLDGLLDAEVKLSEYTGGVSKFENDFERLIEFVSTKSEVTK